jgi:hypothetical protein
MTVVLSIVVVAVAGALVIAAFLFDLGAHELLAYLGRSFVCGVTFGRVRLAETADDSMATAVGAFTVIGLFLLLLLLMAALT